MSAFPYPVYSHIQQRDQSFRSGGSARNSDSKDGERRDVKESKGSASPKQQKQQKQQKQSPFNGLRLFRRISDDGSPPRNTPMNDAPMNGDIPVNGDTSVTAVKGGTTHHQRTTQTTTPTGTSRDINVGRGDDDMGGEDGGGGEGGNADAARRDSWFATRTPSWRSMVTKNRGRGSTTMFLNKGKPTEDRVPVHR